MVDRLRPAGTRSRGAGSKPKSELEALTHVVTLLRRMAWFAFIGLIAVIVLLAVILGLGVGAYQSGDMMTKTSEATVSMHEETLQTKADVTGWINRLKAQFPPNQDVTTGRQILGIIENAHKITTKVEFLLGHMEPDTISDLVTHLSGIAGKVEDVASHVTDEQVVRFEALVDHMQELASGVTPAHITKLMSGVSETAEHVGHMSKEAEESHFVEHSAQLFAEATGTLHNINGGQQISLGFGNIIAPQKRLMRIAAPDVLVKEGGRERGKVV